MRNNLSKKLLLSAAFLVISNATTDLTIGLLSESEFTELKKFTELTSKFLAFILKMS